MHPITAAFRALSSAVRVGDRLRYEIFTGESHHQAVLTIVGEDRTLTLDLVQRERIPSTARP